MRETPDLTLLARQQRQILTELGGMRDDMGVLTAIVRRLDDCFSGLVNEMRAMRSRGATQANRVHGLEERADAK